MTLHFTRYGRTLRLRPLAACLLLASAAGASPAAMAATTHLVTTCTDSLALPACDGRDDGTLRKSYLCAQNGDTVDLTQLQCSVITLSGPLTDLGAAYVTLQGPGSGLLKIDGANKGRVLVHNGTGDLRVNDLTISNGSLDNPYYYSGGGCIYSNGGVSLQSSVVTSCATGTTGLNVARGGAIFANKSVYLFESTVSGSTVHSTYGHSAGGGIFARSVSLEGTTISDNTASSTSSFAVGGGIYATAKILSSYSTISGNTASQGGGAFANSVSIVNSTVTGNGAFAAGGLFARTYATLYSSTIARNTAVIGAAGLFVEAPTTLRLESVILALNEDGGLEFDLETPGAATVTGGNNLIMVRSATTSVPADTIFDDPKLGPLADNGGPTKSLALLTGSPAIDHGNIVRPVTFDQRFFKRVVGSSPDIGALEFVDLIFVDAFDPGEVIGGN